MGTQATVPTRYGSILVSIYMYVCIIRLSKVNYMNF